MPDTTNHKQVMNFFNAYFSQLQLAAIRAFDRISSDEKNDQAVSFSDGFITTEDGQKFQIGVTLQRVK